MNAQRAPQSPELQEARHLLAPWLAPLNANPTWYGSIYYERKRKKIYDVDFKRTQVADSIQSGVVLRIYDGFTLFEQATDDLNPDALERSVKSLVARVKTASTIQDRGALRAYHAPTWSNRLSANALGAALDPEILSQIPANPTASTPVHFGIRFEENPLEGGDAPWIDRGKHYLNYIKQLTGEVSMKIDDLSYLRVGQSLSCEESLFLDPESNLSQSLYRPSMLFLLMSGADRTYQRVGGLGGIEALKVQDCDILTLLRDLRALQKAQRLEAGRHRVLFSPGLTGVLAHEAFGHSQEGDTCARGRSKAWDLSRTGEIVGNEHATILNSPAIYQNGANSFAAWGSYFFDEEGWLAQTQVLLDQGRLKDPMTNLTSALRLGTVRTANGKRENWSHGVYTRQTNTYFSPGNLTYDQILQKTDDGYFASHAAGGMEDPKGMGIQVGILFLHEVKGGKLTGRVFRGPAGGDIQMTGYTPDVLQKIVAKTKIEDHSQAPDRARHPFIEVGGCGKYHKEIVQAGCGGPYTLLDQVVLG